MSGTIGTSHSKSKVVNKSKDTAKAWCQFKGQSTSEIPESYNVTSITDSDVGRYGVNFEIPMSTTTYVVAGCHDTIAGYQSNFLTDHWDANSTTACKVTTTTDSAYVDAPEIHVIIFGD